MKDKPTANRNPFAAFLLFAVLVLSVASLYLMCKMRTELAEVKADTALLQQEHTELARFLSGIQKQNRNAMRQEDGR